MDARVPQRGVKIRFQNVLHAANNVVRHLRRGINDAQTSRLIRHRFLQETLVQLLDYLLLAHRRCNALGSDANIPIEALQAFGLFFKTLVAQAVYNALHSERNGVALHERVAAEQRVEHRLGHQMLRKHPYRFVFGHSVVQIAPQSREETVKLRTDAEAGISQQCADSRLMPLGYLSNPVRPLFPIARVRVFVHHPGQNSVPKFRRSADYKRQFDLLNSNDDFTAFADVPAIRRRRRQFLSLDDQLQLIDFRFKPVVMRGYGVDNLPYGAIRALIHRIMRRRVGRARYRQHDVSEALARRLSHNPANRLRYVYLRTTRVQKHNSVQRRDVYALG